MSELSWSKFVANWINNNLKTELKKHNINSISESPIPVEEFYGFLSFVFSGYITNNEAKRIFPKIFEDRVNGIENTYKDLFVVGWKDTPWHTLNSART